MKKLTFKVQFRICIGVLILSFILATVTKQGVFSNIARVTYGLFFIINPVWPEMWDHRITKNDTGLPHWRRACHCDWTDHTFWRVKYHKL